MYLCMFFSIIKKYLWYFYVCTVCMWLCIFYSFIYACMYIFMYVCLYVWMCIWFRCVCPYILCTYVLNCFLCMYICTVCMYICILLRIHLFMYVFTNVYFYLYMCVSIFRSCCPAIRRLLAWKPSSPRLHAKVSLSKIQNPKIAPDEQVGTLHGSQWMKQLL